MGGVFPTRVGMNRAPDSFQRADGGVPHSRGDEPRSGITVARLDECSPLAWG